MADIEIISVGDLEKIEPLLERGKTFAALLKDKLQDYLYRVLPMWNFLFVTKNHRLPQQANVYLDKRLQDIAGRIRHLLFGVEDYTPE